MSTTWRGPGVRLVLLGIAFSALMLVTVVFQRYANPAFFGAIVLVSVIVVLVEIQHVEHIFVLWILYSFVYYALRVGETDELGMLVWNGFVHAGGIVLNYTSRTLLETQPQLRKALAIALILPVQCNNLFYVPVEALARVILFWGLVALTDGKAWPASVYPLFCKFEAIVPLIVWHLAIHALHQRRPQHVPASELPTVRPVDPSAPSNTAALQTNGHLRASASVLARAEQLTRDFLSKKLSSVANKKK